MSNDKDKDKDKTTPHRPTDSSPPPSWPPTG